MQTSLDSFIQSLPKNVQIEHYSYNPEQILSLIEILEQRYQDVFVFEANLKKTESIEPSYSVIACNKLLEINYDHQVTTLITSQSTLIFSENPIVILKEILKYYSSEQQSLKTNHQFFPFIIGNLFYDFVSVIEPGCGDLQKDNSNALTASIYQYYLLIDHDKQTSNFICIGQNDMSFRHLMTQLSNKKKNNKTVVKNTEQHLQETVSDLTDSEFSSLIDTAKKHIVDGDVFQIVLSRNFYCPVEQSSLSVYRALREISDAAYLFYFQQQDKKYVGASPEKLVSVQNRVVEVCPLAGTRKRTHSFLEKFIEEELLNDEKEQAEHLMLVDLARNDVGSVAKPGTVVVNKLKQLKKYSHVMHLSSNVIGVLNDELDAIDALTHCFPAGTLTGAPKIRAIQLINQLETSSRNFYGGAIFLMDLANNLQSCIAIRMAEISNNVAKIRTGAGIVFDSENKKEILETKNKANLLLHSILLSKEYADVVTD